MEEVPKIGRPSLYKPEYCQELMSYMSQGKPYGAFAGTIGVHIDTLYEWEKVHPEFSEAKKIGRSMSYDYMIELAHSQMIDGKLNNTAWIFMMKNMHGWRDKQETTHEAGKTITLNYSLNGK